MTTSSQPLKILSLDGGGIRGLSSLLILEHLMTKIRDAKGLNHVPRPCEEFDFIGGTSTGGIIAIMLGRLRMSVEECIQAYKKVAQRAFTPKTIRFPASPSGAFSASALKAAIVQTVRSFCSEQECADRRSRGLSTVETCLHSDTQYRNTSCTKTAVLAVTKENVDALPTLLTTYDTSANLDGCTIWEVARATSAATTFFKPIKLGRDGIEFVDAGLGYNNPCQILIEEAHRQFPDRNQMCVLSIGTGFGDVVGLGNSRLSIIKTLKKMATSSKKVASELDAQYGGSGQYHRFNVDHGLQNVTLSDWEKTSKISAHTYIYLKENERAIEEFVNSFANITGDRQSDKALLTTRNLAAQRTRSKIEEMQPTALNTTLADLHLSRNTPSILVTDSIARPPGASASYCVLPFPPNEDIIDRQAIFSELERLLSSTTKYQSAALWGLGGSGKTQVALEYAYRRSHEPLCSVFWVHADNAATFTQDYELIAKTFNLPASLNSVELLAAVRAQIEAKPSWLLVLDNADDLTLFGIGNNVGIGHLGSDPEKENFYNFIPRGPTGTILWTSRDEQIAGSLVGPRRAINVARMTEAEAKELLESNRGIATSKSESADATKLLQDLEWLPLAISQAAAYMRRTRTPIKAYLTKLNEGEKRWKTLQQSRFDLYRRPQVSNSILETWDISINHIRHENELAYDILLTIAFMDNQNISLEIISLAGTYHTAETKNDKGSYESDLSMTRSTEIDEEIILEAVSRLQEFSFLNLRTFEDGNRAYEIHKLVQEAIRYNLAREKRQHDEIKYSNVALRIIDKIFPQPQQETWPECERHLTHAQKVGQWAHFCQDRSRLSKILIRVSVYLFDRGRWREMESSNHKTYELLQRLMGSKHPDTIASMQGLVWAYREQGRLDEAEELCLQVLSLRREILGERAPATLITMRALAIIHQDRGRAKDAELLLLEVIATQTEVLGDRHPDTLKSMFELGVSYYEQDRLEEDEAISTKILKIQREILGENDPQTLGTMEGLAALYHAQEKYDKAEKLRLETLALQRNVLGEKHPDTLWTLSGLGFTYQQQRRFQEAEKLRIDLLTLQREVLGEKHPQTLGTMCDLTTSYYERKKYKEDEALSKQALQLWREAFGDKHPGTLRAMFSLSMTWSALFRHSAAVELMEDCFRLRCEVLGPHHTDTLATLQELETIRLDLERLGP